MSVGIEEPLVETPSSDTESPVELTAEQIARARGDDEPTQTDVVGGEGADPVQEVDPVQEADPEPGGEAGHVGDGDGGKDAAWITEEVRDRAESYGLSDEDLEGFGSETTLNRALAILDRKLSQRPEPSGTPEVPDPATPAADPALLDLEAFEKANYEDDVLGLVKSHNALVERLRALEPAVKQFEQDRQVQSQELQWNQFCNEFDRWADQREESLYGRGQDLGNDHVANRQKVIDGMFTLSAGLHARGERVPGLKVLAERAERMELGEKLSRNRTEAIRRQSATRRPVGRGSSPQQAKGEFSEALAFFREAQEES